MQSVEAFTIHTAQAYLAAAQTRCWRCRGRMPVVCLYCLSGVVQGEPLEHFSVQNLQAIDAALAQQLQRWPHYRFDEAAGCWLNHCPHCQAAQQEHMLHEEPGQPFFDIDPAAAGLTLTPLVGLLHLSGDTCIDV